MDFWPEFLAGSWGREFVAGGVGGMAGVVSGYPLDTLRIRLQQPSSIAAGRPPPSAIGLLRSIVSAEGVGALYRGMGAPLATVAFQNAVAFQAYAVLTRALHPSNNPGPPSYKSVALAGVGTGALQSLILSPAELVKIRLQLQTTGKQIHRNEGPMCMAKRILRTEGLRGIYRGLSITALRDAPAHGVYFCTYEFAREQLHPGCRMSGQETVGTMLVAGGLGGVASWVCCYPLDVIKSRLQAQSDPQGEMYRGIVDCFRKSVRHLPSFLLPLPPSPLHPHHLSPPPLNYHHPSIDCNRVRATGGDRPFVQSLQDLLRLDQFDLWTLVQVDPSSRTRLVEEIKQALG